MGRHKQDNSRTKVFGVRITQDQFNLINLLTPADREKLNNLTRELVFKYTKIHVNKNSEINVNKNSEINVNKNSAEINVNKNSAEINVNKNNDEVKPNIPKPVEEWTQEDINDLLSFEDKLQDAVNKNFKPVKRNKKELSDFEIEQLLVDSDKNTGVNSLFEGGCE